MLQLLHLKKTYHVGDTVTHALDDVTINFRNSEFVAILGPSGSGKTTLLNVIGGLDHYDSGDIIINGKSTKNFSQTDWDAYRNNSVGFIFQSYNLIPVINVLENITLPVELDGTKVDKEYLSEIIDFLGIRDKLYEMPNNLSGGQQQRVAIARALIAKPQIVLADEPTGNLDSKTSEDVMALLKMTSEKFNQTIILITHNNEIAALADRRITIRDGKIIA